jgi:hypothetical protein
VVVGLTGVGVTVTGGVTLGPANPGGVAAADVALLNVAASTRSIQSAFPPGYLALL